MSEKTLQASATTEISLDPRTYRQLADYVSKLQVGVPRSVVSSLNPNPEILGYIDPAVILSTGFAVSVEELAEKGLADAVVPLNYGEGFPTVGGVPFWERLDSEPIDFYSWFKAYRDLPYSLVSAAARAEAHANRRLSLVPARSVREVALRFDQTVSVLHAISICYHWQLRCAAYDSFYALSIQKTRERLAMEMESEHREMARQIFEACSAFFLENQESLTQNSALKWFELATKLERLSLGLPPDKTPAEAGRLVSLPGTGPVQINQNFNLSSGHGVDETRKRVSEIVEILCVSGALPTSMLPDEVVETIELAQEQSYAEREGEVTKFIEAEMASPITNPTNHTNPTNLTNHTNPTNPAAQLGLVEGGRTDA